MRRTWVVLVLTLTLATGGAAAAAPTGTAAHPTGAFDACLTARGADFCEDTFSYLYGDTVVLRGTVATDHVRALVLVRPPRSDRWQRWGSVPIDDGRMTFRWHTHRPDANQLRPYRMRFQVRGHGQSDVVKAYVLFGE
jgi:hypothetical protein